MAVSKPQKAIVKTHPTILDDHAKIVIRFRDRDQFVDENTAKKWIDSSIKGELETLGKEFGDFSLKPLLSAEQIKLSEKLVSKAIKQGKGYRPANFRSFYELDFANTKDLVSPVKYLFQLESVHSAYIDKAGPDPLVDASDDPRSPNQGYLDPAPDGIDAEYAWGFTGGDGEGQRFIDLERGWTLDHEDLNDHGGTMLHGTLRDISRAHGTSVLGEICAVDNDLGCVGIVPNVDSFDVVSFHGSTREAAIIEAIDNLGF